MATPIRIGLTLPRSGRYARSAGKTYDETYRLWAAEMAEGNGLNGRPIEDYFPARSHRLMITSPFRVVGREKDFDVIARLDGGGVAGQAGALRHGIARALVDLDSDLRPALKKEGLLTRDPREKERRKYGLKKARKAPQFSKR